MHENTITWYRPHGFVYDEAENNIYMINDINIAHFTACCGVYKHIIDKSMLIWNSDFVIF